MRLFYVGKLVNVVKVDFKNKESGEVKETKKLQFLEKNEKGVMSMFDVKIDDKEDLSKFETAINKEITIQIAISFVNNKAYYKQADGSQIAIGK